MFESKTYVRYFTTLLANDLSQSIFGRGYFIALVHAAFREVLGLSCRTVAVMPTRLRPPPQRQARLPEVAASADLFLVNHLLYRPIGLGPIRSRSRVFSSQVIRGLIQFFAIV